MPTQSEHCEHHTIDLEGEDSVVIGCKKGHEANAACILYYKGRLDCPDYKAGLLYSTDEMIEKYRLEVKDVK